MDSCNTCGNSYDRCPDVLSGKCVSYQGAPIPCLKLCTGDSISYIQEQTNTHTHILFLGDIIKCLSHNNTSLRMW